MFPCCNYSLMQLFLDALHTDYAHVLTTEFTVTFAKCVRRGGTKRHASLRCRQWAGTGEGVQVRWDRELGTNGGVGQVSRLCEGEMGQLSVGRDRCPVCVKVRWDNQR
jgi:hypothetical protein